MTLAVETAMYLEINLDWVCCCRAMNDMPVESNIVLFVVQKVLKGRYRSLSRTSRVFPAFWKQTPSCFSVGS